MKLNSVKFQSIVNVLMNAATKSTIRCQHSCAIISGGKIISIAVNVIGFHAELHCKKYVVKTNISLIVLRTNSNGDLLNSKPYADCIKYIKKHKIKKIYYSTENGFMCEKSSEIKNDHITYHNRQN